MASLDFSKIPGTIGIFGQGVTGRAVAKFCENRDVSCRVFDEFSDGGIQFSEEQAQQCPIIIRSPGFSSRHKWVKLAKGCGSFCITELELAAQFWRGKIVAITGTNGKTTSTEFLAHALSSCGKCAVSCGNIGETFIEKVDSDCNRPDGWAVVEASSFQMEGSELFHPDFVLWTNFASDHLDVHETLLEYFSCKANLIRHVNKEPKTHCFVGPSVEDFCRRRQLKGILGQYHVCVECHHLPSDSVLNTPPQRENFSLIEKFWEANNFPWDVLVSAAKSFKLPAHRLQLVAKVTAFAADKSVEFWNDSKATNFHALKAALGAFNRKVILIAGGKSKNEPIEDFLRLIDGRVKTLLLIGEVAEALQKALRESRVLRDKVNCKIFDKSHGAKNVMMEVVRYAGDVAEDGDVVLLSPGFSSLDWFKSYEERGKFFEDSVLCLNLVNK